MINPPCQTTEEITHITFKETGCSPRLPLLQDSSTDACGRGRLTIKHNTIPVLPQLSHYKNYDHSSILVASVVAMFITAPFLEGRSTGRYPYRFVHSEAYTGPNFPWKNAL